MKEPEEPEDSPQSPRCGTPTRDACGRVIRLQHLSQDSSCPLDRMRSLKSLLFFGPPYSPAPSAVAPPPLPPPPPLSLAQLERVAANRAEAARRREARQEAAHQR
eukprot:9168883-Pyramimonas_sp.AAC.1